MLRQDVIGFPKLEPTACPNGCCYLTLLKRPPPMLHLLPEDFVDLLDGKDIAEGEYGYLAGVCPECGFVLISGPMEAEG